MEDRQGGPSSPSHSNNDDLEERLFGRLGVAHKEQDALERDLMDQVCSRRLALLCSSGAKIRR